MKNCEAELIYPCAMTIAGSDSSGGAGIEADLRTFGAFGVYGAAAVTAVTAQNPCEVAGVCAVTPEMVVLQMRTVLRKLDVTSVKTGMLANAGIVEAVAEQLAARRIMTVVDPVMVSTSGARLLEPSAAAVVKELLLPVADWITPNVPEAELLLGERLENSDSMKRAALALGDRYGANVVLKGGHAACRGRHMVDFAAVDGELYELGSPVARLDEPVASHGTGCTFSSALAAALALEMTFEEALLAAKSFVYGSLRERVNLGGVHAMYPPQASYLEKCFLRPAGRTGN